MNDNAPQIVGTVPTGRIPEDSLFNTSILTVQAMDIDSYTNSELVFTIDNQGVIFGNSLSTPFGVRTDGDMGEIYVLDPTAIDYEVQENFTVRLKVEDGGTIPQSVTIDILIEIMDVDDNDPMFTLDLFTANVNETEPIGTRVLTVSAVDRDTLNVGFMYQIRGYNATESFFSVDSSSGEIFSQRTLNHESQNTHTFVVEVFDTRAVSVITDTANVSITVLDQNDIAPFFQPVSTVSIDEGSYTDFMVTTLTVVDLDVNHDPNNVVFIVGNSRFYIQNRVEASDSSITYGDLFLNGSLDFETEPFLAVPVTAQDGLTNPQEAFTALFISVQNLDDEPPVFEAGPFTGSVSEAAADATSVASVTATDPDVGVILSYSIFRRIEPANLGPFAIHPISGLVTLVIDASERLDFETFKFYTLEVKFVLLNLFTHFRINK